MDILEYMHHIFRFMSREGLSDNQVDTVIKTVMADYDVNQSYYLDNKIGDIVWRIIG
jgi:hypothetical protein